MQRGYLRHLLSYLIKSDYYAMEFVQQPVAQFENLYIALFEQERAFNQRMGYDCEPDSYIFLHDNNRITANSIDSYYECYCKMLGIAKKGNHGAQNVPH